MLRLLPLPLAMPAALAAGVAPPPPLARRRGAAARARSPRAAAGADAGAAAGAAAPTSTVTVRIRKPLGVVLAERKGAEYAVVVESVSPDGNAAGKVRPGDVVAACSATVLKEGADGSMAQGHGARLYDNWTRVRFDARNEGYDTVMAALASNTERWGITDIELELLRAEGGA